MIRTTWVALNLFVATVLLGTIVITAGALGVRGRIYDWTARTWAKWLLLASGVRLEVEGIEHIALDRPQLVASNHVSWFDVLALSTVLPKRFRFIAKQELGKIPIFGRAWRAAGHIAIDRRDTQAAIAALDRAGRIMREDHSTVVIFPEGTRSLTGQLQPFKKGGFMLAMVSGVEVVPAAVLGTRAIMPRDRWRVVGGRITVRFGAPLHPRRYGEAGRDELITDVRNRIAVLLGQADAPELTAD